MALVVFVSPSAAPDIFGYDLWAEFSRYPVLCWVVEGFVVRRLEGLPYKPQSRISWRFRIIPKHAKSNYMSRIQNTSPYTVYRWQDDKQEDEANTLFDLFVRGLK